MPLLCDEWLVQDVCPLGFHSAVTWTPGVSSLNFSIFCVLFKFSILVLFSLIGGMFRLQSRTKP